MCLTDRMNVLYSILVGLVKFELRFSHYRVVCLLLFSLEMIYLAKLYLFTKYTNNFTQKGKYQVTHIYTNTHKLLAPIQRRPVSLKFAVLPSLS